MGGVGCNTIPRFVRSLENVRSYDIVMRITRVPPIQYF